MAVIGGILGFNLWTYVGTPFGQVPQQINIEKGTSVREVAHRLERTGVVSNALLLKAYIFLTGATAKIRAGEFTFHEGITPREVVQLLKKGDFAHYRITIPEGWTVQQIAEYLGSLGLVQSDLFLQKGREFEGRLYPDTYEIYKPKNEEEVIHKMVGRFREVFAKEYAARSPEMKLTEEEALILASIVEKETGRVEERPLVASVFLNRLARGIQLASDPTVIYGIKNFNGNLTRLDLERPTPYNTYLKAGLPPTAISNPGLASIRAVLHPASTDYLYFVSRGDGTHQFSRSQQEHQRAVQKYQLGGRAPVAP